MRILFFISSEHDISQPKHGAERSMFGLAEALSFTGHEYGAVNGQLAGPTWERDFDLVHHFNSSGGNGPHRMAMRIAHQLDIPSVATPVYWPPKYLIQEMKEHGNVNEDRFEKLLQYQREWLVEADHLLTNSHAEIEKVEEFLGSDCPPQTKLPNAVDMKEVLHTETLQRNPREKVGLQDAGDYVLCVGTIQPRKNQERLVHAMATLRDKYDANLLMAGEVNENYYQQFEPYVDEHMETIPRKVSPAEVRALIAHAKVVAQPSVFETPGLVLLEAAAVGKPIVATERGSTKEYFGEHAHYCDPFRVDSIGNALVEAWEAGGSEELKNEIRANYIYEETAQKAEQTYKKILEEG